MADGTIYISGCSTNTCYIKTWCTDWVVSNYATTISTVLNTSDKDTLLSSVTPGAVREQYNILGKPVYIDTTYSSGNTLLITPVAGTNLASLRDSMKIAVKSISITPIKGTSEKFDIKIEGRRIDL